MNQTLSLTASPRAPVCPMRRRQLVAEYEGSGLSIAEFARKHDLRYQTFYAWVAGGIARPPSGAKPKVCFAEVELEPATACEPIVVELGRQARMRLSCAQQIGLAARLLKELEGAC
jgi:transposase-like protein